MGTLSELLGKRVYLDANVFIYAANAFVPFDRLVKDLFDAAEDAKLLAVTSELTVAEFLVTPFRNADALQEQACRRLLAPRPGFDLVEVRWEMLERAARLRAANRALRLPDAIHLATAAVSGCDLVLTNDQHLRACQDVPVMLLSEMVRET